MSKRMMLLAASALAAVAFAALPAAASAGAWAVHPANQAFTVSNVGNTTLNTTAGDSITCTSVTGSGTFAGASSGTFSLLFHGCKEATLGTNCTSHPHTAGTITANGAFKLGYLEHTKTAPLGLKLEGTNHGTLASFTCAGGLVNVVVTQSVVGEVEGTNCGNTKTTFPITFQQNSNGHQKWTQFTTTGTTTDLTSTKNGTASTGSQVGTGNIHFAQNTTVTCP